MPWPATAEHRPTRPRSSTGTARSGSAGPRITAALDAVFAPFTQALFETADLGPGARVLDLGCGAGETALRAARAVGPTGRVTAADLSEPLLAAARARAALEPPGAAPVEWLRTDAQDHAFEPRFDHALSRFGVMFFDDSAAAFANVRRALVPGGRLSFLCWRSMEENAWVAIPRAMVLGETPEAAAGFEPLTKLPLRCRGQRENSR